MVDPVVALSRALHILAAILLFGGTLFIRFVLVPTSEDMPADQKSQLHEGVMKRWRYVVGAGIFLLLVTGIYNYLVVMAPLHKGDGPYHAWMGIKILLALVVFFFASALAGRSKKLQVIRDNAPFWIGLVVTLSTMIVVIASVLKVRGVPGV